MRRLRIIWIYFCANLICKGPAVLVAAIFTWAGHKWLPLNGFYLIGIFLFGFWLFHQIGRELASRFLFRYHIQPWKIHILRKINSRYKEFYGHYPDMATPKAHSEKMQLYKLHYRHPLMSVLADKHRVRKYLADKGYGNLLARQYAVVDSFAQLNFDEMPQSFVVKVTHNSGGAFVVKDKSSYDFHTMGASINKLMRYPHHSIHLGEWHYLFIKPRIIVEEYLEDTAGELKDYKVHCFANRAEYIQVICNRFENPQQAFFDRNWNSCYFSSYPFPLVSAIAKPKVLPQMLTLAEELSHPFPYVRMDFYCVDDKLYFGEFTFFPNRGLTRLNPPMWDLVLGQYFPEFG